MGHRPGPAFKTMLQSIEDEQLEGRISEKQQAIEWISAHFDKKANDKMQ
jgi:hypothetical protein